MPRLQSITCNVELDPGNTKLREYQQRFRDGAVECFVAVPEMPIPFSVHMHTHGWISSGIAMFVYIDGEYHANRNKACPTTFSTTSMPQHYDIDLRVRQKEEKLPDGGFIGRPWTFTELNLAEADIAPTFNSDRQREIGTIEVVVLRCNYEAIAGATSRRPDVARSARANSAVVRSVKAPSVRARSVKAPSSVKAATISGSDAGLGGMFGLFDGAGDMDNDRPGHFELNGVGDEKPHTPSDRDAPYWSALHGEYTYGGPRQSQLEPDSVFGGVREVDGERASIDGRSAIHREWGQDRIKTVDNTPDHPSAGVGTHGLDGNGYAVPYHGTNESYSGQRPPTSKQPQGYPQHLRHAPYRQRQLPHQRQQNHYENERQDYGSQFYHVQYPEHPQEPPNDKRGQERTENQDIPRRQMQHMNHAGNEGHHGRQEYEDTVARINKRDQYYAQQARQQVEQRPDQGQQAYDGPQYVQKFTQIDPTYPGGAHTYQQQPQPIQYSHQQQFQESNQPTAAAEYPRIVPDSRPGVPDFFQDRDQKVSQYVYDPEYQQYWIWRMDPRMLRRYGVDQGLFAAAAPYLRVLMHIEVRDLRTHQLSHIRGMLEYYKAVGKFPDGKRALPMQDPNATPHDSSTGSKNGTGAQNLGDWMPKSGEKQKQDGPPNQWSGNATAEKSSGKSSATVEHFGGSNKGNGGWANSGDHGDVNGNGNSGGNPPANKSGGQGNANTWGDTPSTNSNGQGNGNACDNTAGNNNNGQGNGTGWDNTPGNNSGGQGNSGGWKNTPGNNNGGDDANWGDDNQNQVGGGDDAGGWGEQKDNGGSGGNANETWGGDQNNKGGDANGGWGGEQNNNQNNDATWGNTDGNAAAPAGAWNDNARSNNPAGPAHSIRSARTSSSYNPRAHIKPYWADWRKSSSSHSADPSTRRRDTAREVFHYPAPPGPTISNDHKDVDASHGVQVGKGAAYAHQRRRPVYLDTMAEPYCVFTFKYRSKQRLEQILNRNIDSDCDKTEDEVQKGNLLAMSKDELVQRLMQQKRMSSGGNTAAAPSGGQVDSGEFNAWGHDGQVNNAAPEDSRWAAAAPVENNNNAGGEWVAAPAVTNNDAGGWGGADNKNGGWSSSHGGKSKAGQSNAGRQSSHRGQTPALRKSDAGGDWGQQGSNNDAADNSGGWNQTGEGNTGAWNQSGEGNTDVWNQNAGKTGDSWNTDGTADNQKPTPHHNSTPTPHGRARAPSHARTMSSRTREYMRLPEVGQPALPTFTPLSADDVFKVGGEAPAGGDVHTQKPASMRWTDPEMQAFDASVQPPATGFKRPVTHLW